MSQYFPKSIASGFQMVTLISILTTTTITTSHFPGNHSSRNLLMQKSRVNEMNSEAVRRHYLVNLGADKT